MYYNGYQVRGGVNCPVCGEREVGRIFFNGWDEIVGCDCCVTEKTADEYLEDLENGRIDREIRRRIEERVEELA